MRLFLRTPLAISLVTSLFIMRVAGLCEWQEEQANNDHNGTVVCNLKILDFRRNSSSAAMQVPSPGLAEASSLRIDCSDVFFFESQLRSDHFGTLPNLTKLEINFCKLKTLPPRTFVGLDGLRDLRVQTHNVDWTSLVMEPDYESLVGLEKLRNLDMRHNNLKGVPSGFVCPLKNLAVLDFSDNAITDLTDLSVSHGKDIEEEYRCTIPLQTLLMRNNGLRTISPDALASFQHLKHLDLSSNKVSVLVEHAFQHMDLLTTLDMSFNRLAAIPPDVFRSSPNLETLLLANNTLGTLDVNVFANLTSLRTLNLSGNNLDENWIRQGIFSGLHKLVVLDLSSNHIARLDRGLFDDLGALQVLDLGYNKIHTITSHSLIALTNLYTLILTSNELENVNSQTLTGLSMLAELSLRNNKIHTLHTASLRNCTGLVHLDLSHNFLTQVPIAVHQSRTIKHLDLGSNLLGVLNRDSLQGMPKLTTLNLNGNDLSRIGEGAFKETPGLKELNLSRNKILKLDQDTFKNVKGLSALDLSENQLEDVNGLLTSQIELRFLNLSYNHLMWFDYAFIPPSLEKLDVQKNNIDSLGNYYALRDNYNLAYIDASGNQIALLQVLSILPGTRVLKLNDNIISKIAPNAFLGKENLATVHLERNRIETIDMSSLMVSLKPNSSKLIF